MEIEDYIQKRRNMVEKMSSTVTDYKIFDFNFIPEKPLLREEIKPVIDAIIRYEKSGIPTNVAIFGSRGSGKTLMIKFLCNMFSQKTGLDVMYINCREYNTSFKIIAHFLNKQPRGSSFSELLEIFKKTFQNKTIIILDEVDLISSKDKNKDIIYFLSRCDVGYMTIILSNNPKFLNELDSSTRSSLQPEVILFRNYDAEQIFQILKQREKIGLRTKNINLLKEISGLTTKYTNSDVRVAIKTLFYCATSKDVSIVKNFDKARKDIYVDLINNLNDTNLLILYSVMQSKENFVKNIYRVYTQLSIENIEKPVSYVYFYNNLSYLQSLGLILLLSTKVNRTYTNKISLLFNEGILREAFSSRFS